MKKVLLVLLTLAMSAVMLTGCGEQKTANDNTPEVKEKEAEKTGTAVLFSDYTQNFGKSIEEVEEEVGKLEALDGWLGVIWYSLTDTEMLGFSPDENDKTLVAAYVPISKIYPQLADRALTKDEFDEYLGVETELVPDFEESEVGSAYLTYKHDNLKVSVMCDADGVIDDTSACMFVEE